MLRNRSSSRHVILYKHHTKLVVEVYVPSQSTCIYYVRFLSLPLFCTLREFLCNFTEFLLSNIFQQGCHIGFVIE